MEDTSKDLLLQLILTRPQATPLIDLLLSRDDTPFFTVTDIQGHGQPDEQLSVQEQVAGAQEKVCIDVEISEGQLEAMLMDIKRELRMETLFYRVIPILRHGTISPVEGGP